MSLGRRHRKVSNRVHRITIMLNDEEMKALDKYCARYNISNRSKLVRESLVGKILKRFADDSPTLFD